MHCVSTVDKINGNSIETELMHLQGETIITSVAAARADQADEFSVFWI
jgi:hypothetical protein